MKIYRRPIVLGGHINGYNIIRELNSEGINEIGLIDYQESSIARFSNKVRHIGSIDGSKESLLGQLLRAQELFGSITVFPTDDSHLLLLRDIEKDIKDFCFIPINTTSLEESLNKSFQYKACQEIGIRFPKTMEAHNSSDLDEILDYEFPVIIKPTFRPAHLNNLFRNFIVRDLEEWNNFKHNIDIYLNENIPIIISEFIPGDDTNIYAYTCYRNKHGNILGEWSGKKLTQHPDISGVFSSASNEAPSEISILGRALVDKLNTFGICEPEFKYDHRDGQMKLMEVNLRSMMWHRVGYLSGVKLHKILLDDSNSLKIDLDQKQNKSTIHFVYFTHEISNLIARPGYLRHFKHNLFGTNKVYWAILEINDIKPFLFGLTHLIRRVAGACLRRLKIR